MGGTEETFGQPAEPEAISALQPAPASLADVDGVCLSASGSSWLLAHGAVPRPSPIAGGCARGYCCRPMPVL